MWKTHGSLGHGVCVHIMMILKYSHSICISPEYKEDDLDATDDGEPSEETHGASNKTQLSLRLDLLVSLNVVKGCRDKVDLNQLKS